MSLFENLFVMSFLLMFILSVLVFISARKHLLLTLLSLEFLVLVVFGVLALFTVGIFNETYFLLLYLTFTVCEGAVGLAVLVSLIRFYGNDNINSLSFLLW